MTSPNGPANGDPDETPPPGFVPGPNLDPEPEGPAPVPVPEPIDEPDDEAPPPAAATPTTPEDLHDLIPSLPPFDPDHLEQQDANLLHAMSQWEALRERGIFPDAHALGIVTTVLYRYPRVVAKIDELIFERDTARAEVADLRDEVRKFWRFAQDVLRRTKLDA